MTRQYKRPLFQHRHYAEIAKVLTEADNYNQAVCELADLFARDNPRFDRGRFEEAVAGQPNKKDVRK